MKSKFEAIEFETLSEIEEFNLKTLKKVVKESNRFYIVKATEFDMFKNDMVKGRFNFLSLNIKYEDSYAPRIAYHLKYYNVTDLVICQVKTKQYVVTAQLFLLLNGNDLQAKITLEKK